MTARVLCYYPIDLYHCGFSLSFKQKSSNRYPFKGSLTSNMREILLLSNALQKFTNNSRFDEDILLKYLSLASIQWWENCLLCLSWLAVASSCYADIKHPSPSNLLNITLVLIVNGMSAEKHLAYRSNIRRSEISIWTRKLEKCKR